MLICIRYLSYSCAIGLLTIVLIRCTRYVVILRINEFLAVPSFVTKKKKKKDGTNSKKKKKKEYGIGDSRSPSQYSTFRHPSFLLFFLKANYLCMLDMLQSKSWLCLVWILTDVFGVISGKKRIKK